MKALRPTVPPTDWPVRPTKPTFFSLVQGNRVQVSYLIKKIVMENECFSILKRINCMYSVFFFFKITVKLSLYWFDIIVKTDDITFIDAIAGFSRSLSSECNNMKGIKVQMLTRKYVLGSKLAIYDFQEFCFLSLLVSFTFVLQSL